MSKRLLNEWNVPPRNPSPDARRASELRRLRDRIPPPVPPIAWNRDRGEDGASDMPTQSRVTARRLGTLLKTRSEEGKMRRILASVSHYPPEEDFCLSLYDDLGVPRTATPEEIRQAHKALVRLLHPDRIMDEYTRRLAENTLKRINAAFAVLCDPQHRDAYDRELASGGGVRHVPRPQRRGPSSHSIREWCARRANAAWLRRNLLWIGGTFMGLLIIYWLLGSGTISMPTEAAEIAPPGRTVAHAMKPAAAAPQPLKPSPRTAAQTRSRQPEPRISYPPQAAASASPVSTRAHIEIPRPAAQRPPLIAPPEVHRAEPELLPPPPELSSSTALPTPSVKPAFDGLWVYLKPAKSALGYNTYPPEFIELNVRVAGGVLRGRYSARYQVADRPISPEVRFQFEGAPSDSSPASFEWTGNGGSRGEVRLTKVGDQQIQVIWFTTEPGPQMGLSSGSATLIRRQTP